MDSASAQSATTPGQRGYLPFSVQINVVVFSLFVAVFSLFVVVFILFVVVFCLFAVVFLLCDCDWHPQGHLTADGVTYNSNSSWRTVLDCKAHHLF